MAESCASSVSACSARDEGPVMDKHGDDGIDKAGGEVLHASNKAQNGPSSITKETDSAAEVKQAQVPTLPNGCINHSVCEVTPADPSAGEQGEKCDNSVKLVNSVSQGEEDAAKNTATSITEGSDCSPAAEQVHDPSIINQHVDSDGVTNSLAKVKLNDEDAVADGEEEEGDGIKLDCKNGIEYVVYESEVQMPDIMRLITKDLSEPYSIYTYRYFIHNWPKLCFLAMDGKNCVGAIVCKLDLHKKMVRRGYIAMLAVDQSGRRRGIGSHLVMKAIKAMVADDCDEVVLETEITNKAALHLYENLGFVRDKRLFRYYLNGVDALRLKLWLR